MSKLKWLKLCPKCKVTKLIEKFQKDSKGFTVYCKSCFKKNKN